MLQRSLTVTGGLCALLFLLTGTAAAQTARPLASLFKRAEPVSVAIRTLEGPARLDVGQDGLFTAIANIETASMPLRSRWDFGDGTTAAGLHARHRYTEAGTYTVRFTLSNPHSEAADSLTVLVAPSPPAPGRRLVTAEPDSPAPR